MSYCSDMNFDQWQITPKEVRVAILRTHRLEKNWGYPSVKSLDCLIQFKSCGSDTNSDHVGTHMHA